MNTVSVFISVLFIYGLFQTLSDTSEYIYTLKYVAYGAVIPYIISLVFNFFNLKKLSMISKWMLLYFGLLIYGLIFNNYIFVFSLGSILSIIIGIYTGTSVVLLNPFKPIYYHSIFSKYITLALIIGGIFWNISLISYFKEIPNYMFLAFGILLFIISAVNMSFILRFIKMIKYIFKIDIKEIEYELKTETITVLLKELSPLWTKNKAIINLQNLANSTWLNNQPVIKEKEWLFHNDDITFFWRNMIRPKFHSLSFKDSVGEFLLFLDENGDCPSVVKEQEKSFGKYGNYDDKESYNILYKQSLIDHVLQLCKLIFNDTKKFNGINLEKMILTALGHDLGKVVAYKEMKGYKTGDHPNASISIIETKFNYFEKLDYYEEVLRMIKNHHSTSSAATPLLNDFKEYDGKARREYLKDYRKKEEEKEKSVDIVKSDESIKINDDSKSVTINKKDESKEISQNLNKNTVSEPILENTTASSENIDDKTNIEANNNVFMPDFISSFKNEENNESVNMETKEQENKEIEKLSVTNTLYQDLSNNTESPDFYKISSFFDINDFIKNTAKNINIIDKGRFSYITVNGDTVLCYTASIIYEVKKSARLSKIHEINQLKDNEIGMSFTEYCRKLGILNTNWIQEGYFQGNFILTNNNGDEVRKGRYIPLKIEAFSEYGNYDDFDSRKRGELEDIVCAKVATLEEMENI